MKGLGVVSLIASIGLGIGFGATARGCSCIWGFDIQGGLVLLHSDSGNSQGCNALHFPSADAVNRARPAGEILMTIIGNRFIPVSRCQYRVRYTERMVEPWTAGGLAYFGMWAAVAGSPLLLWLLGCLVSGLREKPSRASAP